jgi:hypothetical protein
MKRYARQLLLLEDPDDAQENPAENIVQVNDMVSRMGEISNGVHQNDKRVALLAEN